MTVPPDADGSVPRHAGDETRTLVVIDMQVVFADPASPWAAPAFAAIVPAVNRLVARFSPRVILTRFLAPEQPSGAWVEYYRQWPFALQPPDAPLWDLVPELDGGEHLIIDRPTFGKWGHALSSAVGDASGIVLCGVSTDCCVLSTALAAADRGMAVEVVTDACAGATEPDHRRALDAMALYTPLIQLITVDAMTVE